MLKVESMPEDIERRKKARLRNLSIGVLALVLILGGSIYILIRYYQKKASAELEGVKNEVVATQQATEKIEADLADALIAQKQLDNLERLLTQRIFWTKLLTELGHVTIPDVYYTGFSGDIASRTISLPARARNYNALARQLKAWDQEDTLESVEVSSASLEASEKEGAYVSFDASLIFKLGAWQKQ